MNTSVSILFYIKRAKANNLGVCPIYTRVTVNTKRFEFSTNKYINPDKWSSGASKVKGTTEEARTINRHLDYLRNQILEAEKRLFKKDISLNSENLKNELFGFSETKRMLVPIFQDHNNKIKELVGKEYAPGTLERYKTSLRHTVDFLKWKYKVDDIDITRIDYAFVTDYEFYLRSVRNCANNTTVKYIKNFHKIIKICIDNDWITKNPFSNYKAKLKEVEREYLSEDEIQSLINKEFTIDRLSLVRDIFVFSCFTGLAYVDVKNLTSNNINYGIDGEKWIFTHRQKTESASKIPLLPIPETIVEKYKDHPQCSNQNKVLPILTNQRMNSYLKEIAAACNINKELTFHIARHTFATTVTLTNGVPIESVSKMLGHKNLKTTQHYAKILDRKVSEDMLVLRDKFKVPAAKWVNENK
ncbi:site-specific integrase [Flavobacterium macrobrachii]|uniref:Site-specific integrase n=1 Tax=Flavobacterium macrobrachii TaxID=591204 RepID=A0ABS2CWQ9_9FLAO|nr:site-specific integrase [Flavobacterium macrobrachii]MBM6498625.1 site-specific integrase [Flavobacterium macrobrachii]